MVELLQQAQHGRLVAQREAPQRQPRRRAVQFEVAHAAVVQRAQILING